MCTVWSYLEGVFKTVSEPFRLSAIFSQHFLPLSRFVLPLGRCAFHVLFVLPLFDIYNLRFLAQLSLKKSPWREFIAQKERQKKQFFLEMNAHMVCKRYVMMAPKNAQS